MLARLSPARVGLAFVLIGPAWVGISACWNVEGQMAYGAVAFFLLAPIGAFLLIRAAIWRRMERFDALARACSLTQPWHKLGQPLAATGGSQLGVAAEPGRTRALVAPRMSSLSVAGYRYPQPNPANRPAFARMSWVGPIMCLCSLVIAAPILNSVLNPPIPMGWRVRILRPAVQAPAIPGLQPLLVRLVCDTSAGGKGSDRPNLFVNSQAVSWEDFEAVLRKELSSRPPNWPVYLQGDPNLEWGRVAIAIDIIRGLQAEVVLVTHRP
ncbi:MAG: hypothetical protein ABSH00_06180 [Bryobacteraceae bacterium]|jgi:hypothetical protein